MRATDNLQLVEYEPVICKARDCGAILNPHCMVDFHSKQWTCPFCMQRNAFPPHYAQHITAENLPAELIPMCSTIEYIIPQSVCNPPVFLMVLDIALIEEELEDVVCVSNFPPSPLDQTTHNSVLENREVIGARESDEDLS